MVRLYKLTRQANAVQTRLKHLDTFQREDIAIYAEKARNATSSVEPLSTVSTEFAEWRDRVDAQLQCEKEFPAGVRLGTFANSPVKLVDELRCGTPVTVPFIAPALEEWLREIVGNPQLNDAQLRKWMGFELSKVVTCSPEM